jgi:hypothetical protein
MIRIQQAVTTGLGAGLLQLPMVLRIKEPNRIALSSARRAVARSATSPCFK